jgi:predicted DNA-binding transcriptional regulator AlpA
MTEKQVYTVAEVAALTGFSRSTVTRIFEREPGVIVWNVPRKCTSGATEASASQQALSFG